MPVGSDVDRVATWECLVSGCERVLRPGPHYATVAGADAGLRRHLLTNHAVLLWTSDGATVFGRVIRFSELLVPPM